jgi:hypothetical protein
MATLLDDPLYQAQSKAGLDLLGLYNPDQEAQRKQTAPARRPKQPQPNNHTEEGAISPPA